MRLLLLPAYKKTDWRPSAEGRQSLHQGNAAEVGQAPPSPPGRLASLSAPHSLLMITLSAFSRAALPKTSYA